MSDCGTYRMVSEPSRRVVPDARLRMLVGLAGSPPIRSQYADAAAGRLGRRAGSGSVRAVVRVTMVDRSRTGRAQIRVRPPKALGDAATSEDTVRAAWPRRHCDGRTAASFHRSRAYRSTTPGSFSVSMRTLRMSSMPRDVGLDVGPA